jgi:ribosomal protein S18 acetylase RimI-like enzyme
VTVLIRPARSTDAGTTGAILAQFQRQTPWMPDLYTGAQTIAFCGDMIDRGWMSVAEFDGTAIGFLARDGEEICSLYVSSPAHRKGVGWRLLQDARAGMKRLWLRVFEANTGARRFYARAGFDEAGRGGRAQNAENLPEITYVWRREVGI